jgi:hypothetical protein
MEYGTLGFLSWESTHQTKRRILDDDDDDSGDDNNGDCHKHGGY